MNESIREQYLDYLDQLRASQWEGPHESDCDNVPMTLEDFAAFLIEQEQAAADAGPYGYIS